MRLSGIIIFLALATVIAFVAVGAMRPSIDFATQVQVAKDLPESFRIASDPQRWREWHAELAGVDYLRGPEAAAGSFYRLTFRTADNDTIVTRQLTHLDRTAAEFKLEDLTPQLLVRTHAMLQPSPRGGTLITFDNWAESEEVFWHAYHWLRSEALRERQQRDLEALARLIESAPPAAERSDSEA